MRDIKNSEGYTDIVPYLALSHIAREEKAARMYRPLVYICSPSGGDMENNLIKVREFCRFALDKGQIPLAPRLMYPQFMSGEKPEERELTSFIDIILMGKCSAVWVMSEAITPEMEVEITKAKKRRQPVRYFDDSFKEVFLK